MSARVGGHVVEILVEENDTVAAGQVLARIDERDYRIAVDRAGADLARSRRRRRRRAPKSRSRRRRR